MEKHNALVILGPTASGKTRLAARVAWALHGEVIGADSRQVYRKLNIGTGKDLEDYTIDGEQVPFHLIDIAEPGTEYHLWKYINDFTTVWNDIKKRNSLPVICGGSGLYIESVLKGREYASVPVNENLRSELKISTHEELLQRFESIPSSYQPKADTSTNKRLIRAIEIGIYLQDHILAGSTLPPVKPLIIGLDPGRANRRQRISDRLKARMQNGMVEEVRDLLAFGIAPADLIRLGLEYKFITLCLSGTLKYDEMYIQLETAIHQFAKRQMTWFRKMERSGFHIHWLEESLSQEEQEAEVLRLWNVGLA